MGIHGEPGIRRGSLETADAAAAMMVAALVEDLGGVRGLDLALLVNALGATETIDQYILYRAARREEVPAANGTARSGAA